MTRNSHLIPNFIIPCAVLPISSTTTNTTKYILYPNVPSMTWIENAQTIFSFEHLVKNAEEYTCTVKSTGLTILHQDFAIPIEQYTAYVFDAIIDKALPYKIDLTEFTINDSSLLWDTNNNILMSYNTTLLQEKVFPCIKELRLTYN